MKTNSTHPYSCRGLDAYFTPRQAILPLLQLERLPKRLWEPACGDGAIAKVLLEHGHQVVCSDIHDYGYPGTRVENYFAATRPARVQGIVTNPPFKYASQFVQRAQSQVPFLALLLRLNFLESMSRAVFFIANPPSRIWIPARRLPMMHRYGWNGRKTSSSMCHAWFVWDRQSNDRTQLGWFDWKEAEPGLFTFEIRRG